MGEMTPLCQTKKDSIAAMHRRIASLSQFSWVLFPASKKHHYYQEGVYIELYSKIKFAFSLIFLFKTVH
jgi:hypothetical protein